MILILHSHSHVGVVRDLSQWSVYTCERTACNSCSKEKIPVEIVTMAKALTASIGEDIGTSLATSHIKSFASDGPLSRFTPSLYQMRTLLP